MSSLRRTCPPPESMAGMVMSSLLGVVGLVFRVGLICVSLFGLGFGGLGVGDRLVLCFDLLDRLLRNRAFSRFRLYRSLRRRSGSDGRGLLGCACLACAVGLRRHRLLPHQLDDGHRGVVAL